MVIHILKDGSILNDITGHVVKKEDVPSAYSVIDHMNEVRKIRGNGHEKVRTTAQT